MKVDPYYFSILEGVYFLPFFPKNPLSASKLQFYLWNPQKLIFFQEIAILRHLEWFFWDFWVANAKFSVEMLLKQLTFYFFFSVEVSFLGKVFALLFTSQLNPFCWPQTWWRCDGSNLKSSSTLKQEKSDIF